MEWFRNFLSTAPGKGVAAGVVLVGCVAIYFSFRGAFGLRSAAAFASDRTFIDTATDKPFEHVIQIGESIPVKAPSGDATGYPAELCYWTADGQTKDNPTPVLLNQYKGTKGATFCPDCGRLVVGHNPHPQPGMAAPPTRAEYETRQAARGRSRAGATDARDSEDRR